MDSQLSISSRKIVNIFGAIGYSLIVVLYGIIIAVILAWLINGGHLVIIGMSPVDANNRPLDGQNLTDPSAAVSVLSYVFTALMLLIVGFVMVTLPYWLGKICSSILRKAFGLLKIKISSARLLVVKCLVCLLAAIPLLLLMSENFSYFITSLAGLAVILLAVLLFMVQHGIAKMSQLDIKDIW